MLREREGMSFVGSDSVLIQHNIFLGIAGHFPGQ